VKDINPRATEFREYRRAVRELCVQFDSQYWWRIEEQSAHPETFVQALTDAGWLSALIPTEYGGAGLGITEASVILEEINRSGANSGACHFDNVEVPAENLIGDEGEGFRYILDGMNAERILIATECIGDGFWFIDKGARLLCKPCGFRAPDRSESGYTVSYCPRIFQRARRRSYALRGRAAHRCRANLRLRGEYAKLVAADASWESANVCLQTHGGFGFAAEYDVERKFRETRLYQVAPVSTNMILSYMGEHVLGMPRSF
jgi:acyl-CoA dehydrogenase